MKTLSVADAQVQLTLLVDALQEGPVLLLRKGQPCAALVGLGERFDREAFTLGRNKRLRRRLDEACSQTKKSGGIPFAEILAEMESRPASARSGNRTS